MVRGETSSEAVNPEGGQSIILPIVFSNSCYYQRLLYLAIITILLIINQDYQQVDCGYYKYNRDYHINLLFFEILFHIMIVFLLIVLSTNTCLCDPQTGPDPWDYEGPSTNVEANFDMPPDIRMQYSKKAPATASDKLGTGEWFFRRMLGVMLKGGQNKVCFGQSVILGLQHKPINISLISSIHMPLLNNVGSTNVNFMFNVIKILL